MTTLIAVEHYFDGLAARFPCHIRAFMVSLLSGKNEIAKPTGFLTNRSRTTARYVQCLIYYITVPYLF